MEELLRSGPLRAINSTRAAEGGLSERRRLLLELLLVLMCLAAVIGNTLVIVIVAATKTLRAVTSLLIMNLAVSDLLVGVGVMPFVAVSVINHGWLHCSGLCKYVGYTSSVYCTASVLTLAAIALDRYHSIMDCLRYSSRCTLCRTCAVVVWIWLQALATCSPPLLGWSSVAYAVPMYTCAINWAGSPGYTALVTALSYLIPAVVIVFCYSNIIKVARSHARRIRSLQESLQHSSWAPGGPSQRFICEMNENSVSAVSSDEGNDEGLPETLSQPSNPSTRRMFSILAKGRSQTSGENIQQHHHGVVRLLLIMGAFLLCWTPYVSVALVQAAETAVRGSSTLIPDSAITASYWLMLLNSDINPLLYALLSKRFQRALRGLGSRAGARVMKALGREAEFTGEGEDGRSGDPHTLTSAHPSARSSTESLTSNSSNHSSIFTISTGSKSASEPQMCKVCQSENTSGDRTHNLQVPSRPPEGSRLPFSALTDRGTATFLFGQVTVRVEHDIS